MGVLDIDDIRQQRDARDRNRQEAAAWCKQALSEFAAAAQELETPRTGNPDYLQRVFKEDAHPGVWAVLRDGHPDIFMIDIGHGVVVTMKGKVLCEGKPDAESAAWWIAARCGYQIPIAEEVFRAALLGESLSMRDSLGLVNK